MNECKLVEDLLPLYAEDLVSLESADFIREHAASCERCATLLARTSGPVQILPEDPKAMKKGLRKDKLKLAVRGVLTVLLILTIFLGPVIGYFVYMVWESGELAWENTFLSEDAESYHRIDVYDWDTAGFFATGQGSIVKHSYSVRVVDDDGIGTHGASGTFYAPWENIRVDWAPNGQVSLITADLVAGGTCHFLQQQTHWINPDGSSSGESKTIPANYSDSPGLTEIMIPLCQSHPDFPRNWQSVNFSFYTWSDDSETLTFIYETDNGHRGFLDYHYPTETITAVD